MLATITATLFAWKAKGAAFWLASKAKALIFAAIAIGVLVVAGFIYSMGASSERGKCNVAALRSQIAAMQKDLDTIRKAAADEKAKTETLDKLAVTQAAKLKEYEDELAKRPDRCALTPADLGRLR